MSEFRWTPPARVVIVLTATLLFLLHVFDAVATLAAMDSGRCYETNPIAQAWLNLGDGAFLAIKTGVGFLLSAMLAVVAHNSTRYGRVCWWLLLADIGIQTLALLQHLGIQGVLPLLF